MFQPLVENNIVNPWLLKILSFFGIAHEGTLESIVQQTQAHFLRAKNKERWDINSVESKKLRSNVLPCLKHLGLVNTLPPSPGVYDYVVVFGFVSINVQRSFDCIDAYLQSNVLQTRSVVLLTSSLPLPPGKPWYKKGQSEADWMVSLYTQSLLSRYPYTCINVPMITEKDIVRRPTTEDTVHAWLKTKPVPGKVLVVSSLPFIRRQTRILEMLAPQGFSFAPSGPAAERGFPLALYLDELARMLYQEQHYLKSRC